MKKSDNIIEKMSITYGVPSFDSVLYSNKLKEQHAIKVNTKKNQRRYNENLRLFCAELLFLSLYILHEDTKTNRIVYIGAAPGFHLVKLMKMFPLLKFDLYDDQDLHSELELYIDENPDQVTMYRELFTIETCSRYKNNGENIYLVTDHRDPKFMVDPIFTQVEDKNKAKREHQKVKEASYMNDMLFQKDVCKELNPLVAYLRFRPPHYYEDENVENPTFQYFKGNVILMIYNDYKSTESRLVVTDFSDDQFNWNYRKYQYYLNNFNDEVRESLMLNPFTNDQTPLKNQLGNKFETVMLMFLLKQYFKLQGITNVKSDYAIRFYTEFVIAESCASLSGMYKTCEIKNNEENEENQEYTGFDDFDDIRVVEDDMY